MMMRNPRSGGFTLLEIIVALGILAVGATTALALLVAAASTGRRAEHHVQAALLADSVIADLSADVTLSWTTDGLAPAGAPELTPAPRPPSSAPTPAATPAPTTDGLDLRESPPTKSFYAKKDAVSPAYPDYHYDVIITPCGGPPATPWEFFVEVDVRWSERSQRRQAVFSTVILRRVVHLDNDAPPR
jgi:prepilin-type N-terminal cleavage/methylation domain-containing protein